MKVKGIYIYFGIYSDCISVGEFKNGKKIGRWDFEFKRFKM